MRVQASTRAAELARAQPATYVQPPGEDYSEFDLALIESRCRLKSKSCRVGIERRAALGDPAREPAMIEQVHELLDIVKPMTGCFLWALSRDRVLPPDDAMRTIASCYDALGDACAAAKFVDDLGEAGTHSAHAAVMTLMAEACSALLASFFNAHITEPDRDQVESYQWLRRRAAARRILIPRHMRLDDPADPNNAADLMRRIAFFRSELDDKAKRGKTIKLELNKVRHHGNLIAKEPEGDKSHDWKKIAGAIKKLAAIDIQPGDDRIGEALAAITHLTVPPDVVDEGLAAALDAARARLDVEEEEDSSSPHKVYSARVAKARELLSGRRIVLVGGEEREQASRRLRDAFNLGELHWIALSEHASSEPMRAQINNKDTVAVLMLVRLAGHQHVEDARKYARAAGKAFVLIKAGYNPEQVAEAVLTQVSEQIVAVVS